MTNAPFGDCASAELHRADHIQSYGALVVIDKRSQLICACSANIHAFSGKPPPDLLGAFWSVLFTADQLPSLFAPVDEPGSDMPHLRKR